MEIVMNKKILAFILGNIFVFSSIFTSTASAIDWYWPFTGFTSHTDAYDAISSSYGFRGNPYNRMHYGMDILMPNGTDVYPVREGVVFFIDDTIVDAGGRMIIIDHQDGYYSTYMHLSQITVSEGQYVNLGTVIGKVGGSGFNQEQYYANHLHLQLSLDDFTSSATINPCPPQYASVGSSLEADCGGYVVGEPNISYILTRPNVAPTTKPQPKINVVVDGYELDFDVAPRVINDRTMVPMRTIFEALGATVSWDSITQSAYAVSGRDTIQITNGEYCMHKNNRLIPLDAPATIIDGRTMVPARAVAEALDCMVEWDGETHTVYIYSN